ncbi:MAG: site-specific integrase [Phycisphaerales bacterium]
MSERYFEYGHHWLIRRKDTPNFHIYWCKPGTRRVRRKSTHTEDLELAKQRLIEFVHEKQRPSEQSPAHVSIHDALNEYLEKEMVGRASYAQVRSSLRHWNHFLAMHDLVFVSDMTLDAQDRFVEWRLNAGVSNGTILRELAVLRASLQRFVRRGILERAPYIRRVKPPPARNRFLSIDELERLYGACEEPHLLLFVRLAIQTLQRPCAIFDLRVEQVDFDAGRIDFLPEGLAQSNKRRPVVRIGNSLERTLRAAIEGSASGYLVEYRGRPVKCIRRSFRRACARAGLDGVIPYTLRHTGATLLAADGVPLWQIAGMLGHSQQRTTEIYAKHHPDYQEEVSSAIDRLFGELGQPSARQTRAKADTAIEVESADTVAG